MSVPSSIRQWLLIAVVVVVELPPPVPPGGPGETILIRQFDVGQGDAALITAEGKAILIDAGPDDETVSLLREAGVDTLDLVVASHNHADHIGGMPEVLSRFVVRAYVDNGVPHATAFYRSTLDALEREPGLLYLSPTQRTLSVGPVRVKILPPSMLDPSQNNNSLGVLLEYGEFRALFTGDSERLQLNDWIRKKMVPTVNVLKAAHHGSSNGLTAEWKRATNPQVVTVSAGVGNIYGHPALETIFSWRLGGARVFRTDRHGTIEITADRDGRISVTTQIIHSRQ